MKVLYYGHVGSTSGYGRAAADLCMSLLATGKVELDIGAIDYRPDRARIALAGAKERLVPLILRPDVQKADHDVVIIHTLPMDLSGAYEAIDPSCPCVAYTTWEGATASPDVVAGYCEFDQIWVPSEPCMRALIGAELGAPIQVVPHAFDPAMAQVSRGLHDDFRFYYIGAWNSRKNPAGLLRAWAMAFSKHDSGVSLTLHCPGASIDQYVVALHQTGLSPSEMAPVLFSSARISEADVWKMHCTYDCFVTASRGEAWNLPAFDAMLAGRMIIAPRRHGSSDFLADTSAIMIDGMEMPATVDVQVTGSDDRGMRMQTVGAQGLSSRSTWIEPDLVQLADSMRVTRAERRRDLEVFYDPAARYSYEAVGKLALSALEEL